MVLLTLTQARSRKLVSKNCAAVDIECIHTHGVLDMSIILSIWLG